MNTKTIFAGVIAAATLFIVYKHNEVEEREALRVAEIESRRQRALTEERAAQATREAKAKADKRDACERDRAAMIKRADAARAPLDIVSAAESLIECGKILADNEMQAKGAAIQVRHYGRVAQDRSAEPNDRLVALRVLEQLAPATYEKLKSIEPGLHAAVDAAATRAQAAARKSQGVSIGMTEDEVRQSNWGRPQKINRTTTARGTREQWVYPGGQYLYFDDGVLTAVQN